MLEFICNWIPTLAFLTGTILGPLLYYLWTKDRREKVDQDLIAAQLAEKELKTELAQKEHLEADHVRTKIELEELSASLEKIQEENKATSLQLQQLKQEKLLANSTAEKSGELQLENEKLRKKLKKLKKTPSVQPTAPVSNSSRSEFESFLLELEKTIQKAKKNTSKKEEVEKSSPFNVSKETKKKKDKKKSKKKDKSLKLTTSKDKKVKRKKSKSKSKDKKVEKNDAFKKYAEKYALSNVKKELTLDILEPKSDAKDLTYLYGIDKDIQKVLNDAAIFSFEDLSQTKIARLKEILSEAGPEYADVQPLNWPIQARIAVKENWDILEEYKSKMREQSEESE